MPYSLLFSPRISLRDIARLCRALAVSLEAGIDLRTIWSREVERAIGPMLKSRLREIGKALDRGESLPDAVALTADYFPEIFRKLIHVGDESGHLAECLFQLAEHYEEQIKLRRMLIVASVWPLTQLGIAITIIGFMIWFMGTINTRGGAPIDPLGFGLIGGAGLVVYLTIVGLAVGSVLLIIHAIRRGLVWTRPIQRLLLQPPLLGPALQTVALSRLSWAMHLTLDAGMDLRKALALSLWATRNARYSDHVKRISASIEEGNPIHEAFLETGVFPAHFLEAVRVGEQSGKLVESMALLSRQYREQAEAALRTLTQLGGFGIWALVAAMIIFLIFRLAMFYIGTISEFL